MQSPRAPRGASLTCKGWRQEGLYRLFQNNLENAERPQDLIVYGGTGKLARDVRSFEGIRSALARLGDDETLLVQSGKPVGVFRTHDLAPRVLVANSNLVPAWATWEHARALEARGLWMYGQMTAGSWCYIGSQGILQGTYETFMAAAQRHFGGSLSARIVLTGGLGGMGGAQPLAVKMAGGVCVAVEVDPSRIRRRLDSGYCDVMVESPAEAVRLAEQARQDRKPLSIALLGNCADVLPAFLARGFRPDVVTDQTSAHDALNGYVPGGMAYEDALALRAKEPATYQRLALASMARHCHAMVGFLGRGAIVFDYGNNLRGQALAAGFAHAFAYPGFVQAYVRPMFCQGRGPFRWIALSGDPDDIQKTHAVVRELFPHDAILQRWIDLAERHVPVEGLPARVCWLGLGERERFAARINDMVARGELSAPVAITRDHLDTGSVASPYRETEGMADGSDAIADWPILNALLNTAAGADLVAVHSGGGVGVGLSVHAGMIVVADGSARTAERIGRVFVTDPGIGVLRHADAGYPDARRVAREQGLKGPLQEP
ncbi:MAG TPA: urocanate hydratase [Candidatus Thermoplasmatota archaeon]|nr:urocanate hydratase [Candidatus Thermoplasmatota archaeon]